MKKMGTMKNRTMECCRPTDEGRQHTVNRAHRHVFLIITKNIQPG